MNKIAIILGSGPSLRNIDTDLIKSCTVFAINSSILKVPQADYYFSCDHGMTVWKSWLTLRDLKCKLVLQAGDVGFRHLEYLTKIDTFEGIDRNRVSYFNMQDGSLLFKKTKYELIRGATSTQVATNYAYTLGFRKFILYGCDNKYVDGKYHYYDFPNEVKDDYRKDEYKAFKRIYSDYTRFLDVYAVCWKKIIYLNQDIEIIDASCGNLNMFQQMTLRDAIDSL